MSDETPKSWKDMTPQERSAYARQKKAEKKAARDAALLAQPIGAAEEVPARDDGAAERRSRLLDGVDPDTAALISDEELAQIEREEAQRARDEAKKQAISDIRARARQEARVANDLIPMSILQDEATRKRLNEPVTFRVMLPGDGAGHRGQNGFRVDGRLYQVGRTYTLPRHMFESMQANHYRAWLNEVRFKTLDQHKSGNSAAEILAQTIPSFEVRHAA